MKYADLIKFNHGGRMEADEASLSVGRGKGAGASKIASIPITASKADKAAQLLGAKVLKLNKGEGGGLWIPYLAGMTIYDYISGGQTWVASGPFSGCYFEVGQSGGKTYAAHISCESRNDPNVAAWEGVLPGRTVLFRAKMSMSHNLPAGTTNAAAIAFASIVGTTVEVTRVDVQTSSAGGMTGPIFDVQKVPNQR